ncbi:pimeloyl-ACP methyl ester carboxylesterase [Novosphingobium chloroacetimidivorans]|uniref:Pimeloyl-ACP methyl ester carboxylesterase n=1 Tax=Novosphingobium chloroacetimidivorans TaxID=1428314 RepID=A0A7W7KA12_9SPHN|nr:alpha/beta hydrolase [Novosphingobium chloroacetimidivorans]MBB4858987.1 pimeloyl-ACP methyl ester carboxylesterase [Novosphingobium chloroacetimidivorans]
MQKIDVNGINIAYELLGKEGDPAVALTPGGRFTMDVPGLREMAEEFVKAGKRVLIYDRPNCGYSDATLLGASESETQAEALAGLIRKLDLGPTVIAGGSGGSRVSMLAAARDPEICSHLVLWWISGDPIGLMQLATYYCGEAGTLASVGGMEAVMKATSWAENFQKSEQSRAFIKAQDPAKFIEVMQRWAAAYVPSEVSPVPGMTPRDFARLTMPVLVFRSGKSDLSHTRATSEWVHRLVPHSLMQDPPWEDNEWNYRSGQTMAGTEGHTLFRSWPKLVPQILDFIGG